MSHPLLEPEIQQNGPANGRWMVVIFNNDHNTLEDVIGIIVEATGCDLQEAYIETWEAHTYGKASVHFASREECDRVARVIGTIGVQTEVTLEWPE